jgi:hypothetical protein
MRTRSVLFLCLSAGSWSLYSQAPVTPTKVTPAGVVPNERLTARVLAVVPLVGTGKPDDPIRPMFALSPKELTALPPRADRRPPGIMASHYLLSDDKKSAIVEFMEADRATLAPLLNSTDARVKVFERGVHNKATIEAEFQKVKGGFTIESLSPARFSPTLTRTLTPVRIAQ